MQLRDRLAELEQLGATLWAISTDDLEQARALAERLELSFPLGADPGLHVIRAFNAQRIGDDLAQPVTLVLAGRTGRIVYRFVGDSAADRPKADEVVTAVKQAR